MQIRELELNNYRNYESLKISFSPDINIIYGENAQGKTNILEGIYMCGLGRSHRNSREGDIIKQGKEQAHIKGVFEKNGVKARIDIHLKRSGGKGIAINRIPIHRISELYGKIGIVIFSPEDLEIIKKGPAVRRTFMDRELCQVDPIYVEDLISYSKILKQRHELLKKYNELKNEEIGQTLEVWDIQLVNYGNRIIERRRRFIKEINGSIYDIHKELTGGKEKLSLVYKPSVEEEDFYEQLLKNREKDLYRKQTSCGPHRDDLVFYESGKDLRVFGSQGQQRSSVLSLKLAEIKMMEKEKEEKPILLLDDVLSELDRSRQMKLLKGIGGTQTIITSTGMDEFIEGELETAKKFYIKNAAISDR